MDGWMDVVSFTCNICMYVCTYRALRFEKKSIFGRIGCPRIASVTIAIGPSGDWT